MKKIKTKTNFYMLQIKIQCYIKFFYFLDLKSKKTKIILKENKEYLII